MNDNGSPPYQFFLLPKDGSPPIEIASATRAREAEIVRGSLLASGKHHFYMEVNGAHEAISVPITQP